MKTKFLRVKKAEYATQFETTIDESSAESDSITHSVSNVETVTPNEKTPKCDDIAVL